jgi:hypothetical protein
VHLRERAMFGLFGNGEDVRHNEGDDDEPENLTEKCCLLSLDADCNRSGYVN